MNFSIFFSFLNLFQRISEMFFSQDLISQLKNFQGESTNYRLRKTIIALIFFFENDISKNKRKS